MFLVERTFTLYDGDVETLFALIVKNRSEALTALNEDGTIFPTSTYTTVTNEMCDATDILFRSNNSFFKNGEFVHRSVVLYKTEDQYKRHCAETIGIPTHIAESALEMSFDGLRVDITCDEI